MCGLCIESGGRPLAADGDRPTLPPMRWRRWVIGLIVVLAALLLAAWLAVPYVVASVVNQSLPRDLGEGVRVQRVHVGAPEPTEVHLSVPRPWAFTQVRDRGHAVPWWAGLLVRPGLSATGRWRDRELAADFAWAVTVVRRGEPRLDLAVPAPWINQRLAEANRSHPADVARWTYTLNPGSTLTLPEPATVDPDRIVWHLPAAATGVMTAGLGDYSCTVAVDELTGVIDLIAQRVAGTWQFRGEVTIATCRHRVLACDSPLLRLAATNLRGVLQVLFNERLSAANMRDLTLPEGFPLELIGALVVTDAPLPPLPAANDATPRPPVPLPPGSRPQP